MCFDKNEFIKAVRRLAISDNSVNEFALIHSYASLNAENKDTQFIHSNEYYYNKNGSSARSMKHNPPIITLFEDSETTFQNFQSNHRATQVFNFQLSAFIQYTDDANKLSSSARNRSEEKVYQEATRVLSSFLKALMQVRPVNELGERISDVSLGARIIAAARGRNFNVFYMNKSVDNLRGVSVTFPIKLCACN